VPPDSKQSVPRTLVFYLGGILLQKRGAVHKEFRLPSLLWLSFLLGSKLSAGQGLEFNCPYTYFEKSEGGNSAGWVSILSKMRRKRNGD